MGDIADMMLDGTLCQLCGVALDDSLGDFPQYCPSCARENQVDERAARRMFPKTMKAFDRALKNVKKGRKP